MTPAALSLLTFIRDNRTDRSGVLPIDAGPGEFTHVYIGGYKAKIVPTEVWAECAGMIETAMKPGRLYELKPAGRAVLEESGP